MAGAETRNTSKQGTGSGASGVDDDQFTQYQAGQLTVAGITYAFPVRTIRESGENRIVERERPYRDGAKLDDTGSKATHWSLEVLFHSTSNESDIDSINGGLPLYPDVLNEVRSLFDTHETGDLVVPTVGKKRVKAVTFERVETWDARDSALVNLVFAEDNEDNVDFRSLAAASANANARRLGETTTFDAQSSGAWHASLSIIDELAASLESLVNAPGTVEQDVKQVAKRIQGNAVRVGQAFKNSARAGRDLFNDPSNSRAERKLVRQRDMSARSAAESRRGRPQLVAIVFYEATTLFRVSVVVNQSFEDLLEVNPLIDPFFILAGTQINVFTTQELLNGKRQAS